MECTPNEFECNKFGLKVGAVVEVGAGPIALIKALLSVPRRDLAGGGGDSA